MIRPLAALTRQVQDFFLMHLTGTLRWEDVEFMPRERNVNPPPESWERTKRGRRIRPERLEGKFHAELKLRFGVYDMTVSGPQEHPPLGQIQLFDGNETIEGALDPATWQRIAEHIKKNHTERKDGSEYCESIGEWGGGSS